MFQQRKLEIVVSSVVAGLNFFPGTKEKVHTGSEKGGEEDVYIYMQACPCGKTKDTAVETHNKVSRACVCEL